MPSYRVLEPGFFEGVYRSPGHPRHGVVQTDKPLKPVPKWLKLIAKGDESESKDPDAAVDKKLLEDNKIETTGAMFLQPTGSNNTPEKL